MGIIIILILQFIALRHRKVNSPIHTSSNWGIWDMNLGRLTRESTTLTIPHVNFTLNQPAFLSHGAHFLTCLSNFPSRDTLPPCFYLSDSWTRFKFYLHQKIFTHSYKPYAFDSVLHVYYTDLCEYLLSPLRLSRTMFKFILHSLRILPQTNIS